MHLEIHAKQPGPGMQPRVIKMNAGNLPDHEPQRDAYESLLADIIRGVATNVIRFDEAEWVWRVVEPNLKSWGREHDVTHTCTAGVWVPGEANGLFERNDQVWRNAV